MYFMLTILNEEAYLTYGFFPRKTHRITNIDVRENGL